MRLGPPLSVYCDGAGGLMYAGARIRRLVISINGGANTVTTYTVEVQGNQDELEAGINRILTRVIDGTLPERATAGRMVRSPRPRGGTPWRRSSLVSRPPSFCWRETWTS